MIARLFFGPLEGVFLLVGLLILALKIWALVDAARRPAAAFVAAMKQSKPLWLGILLAALLLGNGIGILGLAALVATIVYLVDVRPAVREVQRGR